MQFIQKSISPKRAWLRKPKAKNMRFLKRNTHKRIRRSTKLQLEQGKDEICLDPKKTLSSWDLW